MIKIVLLAKGKLNTTDVLNPKTLMDSYITHESNISTIFLAKNVVKEYNGIKEVIKNSKISVVYRKF